MWLFITMLFFHFVGFSIWLGSLISLTAAIFMLKNQTDSNLVRTLLHEILKLFKKLIYPSAFMVLISGLYMVFKIPESIKPFWLHYMEKGGIVIVFLSTCLLCCISKKLTKQTLNVPNIEIAAVKKRLSTYFVLLTIIILLILSVVFIVLFEVEY